MKIYLPVSSNTQVLQYTACHIAEGFSQIGHDVMFHPCADIREIAQCARDFRPDLIVLQCLHRTQYNSYGIPDALPTDVPCITWIQDYNHFFLTADCLPAHTEQDYVAAMWPFMADTIADVGFKRVSCLPPIAGLTYLKHDGKKQEKMYDIGFACNLNDHSAKRFVQRSRPLRWAMRAGLRVALWGRGWEAAHEFDSIRKGPVEQGTALAHAYGSCKLFLHVNEDTNLHQRPLEAIATGTLPIVQQLPDDVLSDPRKGFAQHFPSVPRFPELGEGIFVAQVQKYLDDKTRNEALFLALHGLSAFLPSQRAREMMELVKNKIP